MSMTNDSEIPLRVREVIERYLCGIGDDDRHTGSITFSEGDTWCFSVQREKDGFEVQAWRIERYH